MEDDETVNRLKRGAEELGIDLIDLKSVDEEKELIEHCHLPNTLETRGKLRRKIRQLRKPPVFQVSARVKNAKNSYGARGNVYKLLEVYGGSYSKAESNLVIYEDDDLTIKAYFWDRKSAMDFQTALNQWEIHKALVNLDGIEIYPRNPLPMAEPPDLIRFILQDYVPNESESPCEGLDQLDSYRLSVPVTEAVELNDPIAIYQSLDVCVGRNKPYKCHLKDKAKFKSIARNENNILAASWALHQMLDGLNHADGMSVVKLSVASSSTHTIADKDNRFAVVVQLEFFNAVEAAAFQSRVGALKVNNKTWQTTVHVKDKTKFTEFVSWKGESTQKQWTEHQRILQQI